MGEFQALRILFQEYEVSYEGWIPASFWTNANDLEEQNVWRWGLGGELAFPADAEYWGPGEPGGSQEHCANFWDQTGWMLNDMICDNLSNPEHLYYPLCQKLKT